MPFRPAFHRGALPASAPRRPGSRVRGHRRSGRLRGRLRQEGRPRHHLPLRVLRHLRQLHDGTAVHLHRHEREDATGCRQALEPRRQAAAHLHQPLLLRGDDARPRERHREDRPRLPPRPRSAHRLRRHHRLRRGGEHGQGRARRDRRRHRLRRCRHGGDQRCRDRRRGTHHRRRHQPGEAAARHQARRHRSRQSEGRRSGAADQGPHEGRRASRHRVPRHQDHRRAGVPDAGGGRHGHHRRHGSVRTEDRAARLRLPARAQDPRLVDGLQPLPCRHAAADRVLQAAQAAPRRLDLRPDQALRDQPRLRQHEGRQGRAQRHRVRRASLLSARPASHPAPAPPPAAPGRRRRSARAWRSRPRCGSGRPCRARRSWPRA